MKIISNNFCVGSRHENFKDMSRGELAIYLDTFADVLTECLINVKHPKFNKLSFYFYVIKPMRAYAEIYRDKD